MHPAIGDEFSTKSRDEPLAAGAICFERDAEVVSDLFLRHAIHPEIQEPVIICTQCGNHCFERWVIVISTFLMDNFGRRLGNDPLQLTLAACRAVLLKGDPLRHLEDQAIQLSLIAEWEFPLEYLHINASTCR